MTRKNLLFFLMLLTLAASAFGYVNAQDTPAALAENPDTCVTDYDADVDYFPEKVSADLAEGFEVEYFNNYKVVTVTRPWFGASEADAFQYVLVQCGTPAPEDYENAQILEVPVNSVIALSTTQLPHLVDMGLLDTLVGIDTVAYVSTPEILEKFEAGDLLEVGGGSGINIELVLESETDLVMTFGSGLPEYDAHPVLLDAGVPVALNAEFADASPLARAEWIKFTSVFFNTEAEANEIFDEVVNRYNELTGLVQDIPEDEKPVVLWNAFSSFYDAWDIPGAATYTGQLLVDAGAQIALGDIAPESSAPAAFEMVYDGALDADFWFVNTFGVVTPEDLIAFDERYSDFTALQNGNIYNNDGRLSAGGGNDFYESGVTNPHIILADLISIIHPDLLPDHELVYFRQMTSE